MKIALFPRPLSTLIDSIRLMRKLYYAETKFSMRIRIFLIYHILMTSETSRNYLNRTRSIESYKLIDYA